MTVFHNNTLTLPFCDNFSILFFQSYLNCHATPLVCNCQHGISTRVSSEQPEMAFLEGNGSLKVSDLEKIRLILSKPFARDTRVIAKQLCIFVRVSALLTLCLCSGGINAHAVF